MITHIDDVDVIDTIGSGGICMHADIRFIGIGASRIDTWAVERLIGSELTQIVTGNKERVFANVVAVGDVGVPALAVGVPIPPVECAALLNIDGGT